MFRTVQPSTPKPPKKQYVANNCKEQTVNTNIKSRGKKVPTCFFTFNQEKLLAHGIHPCNPAAGSPFFLGQSGNSVRRSPELHKDACGQERHTETRRQAFCGARCSWQQSLNHGIRSWQSKHENRSTCSCASKICNMQGLANCLVELIPSMWDFQFENRGMFELVSCLDHMSTDIRYPLDKWLEAVHVQFFRWVIFDRIIPTD